MNWLQKIAQKPMATVVPPPDDIDRETYRGIDRIDEIMSEETAQQEYVPGTEWGDAGSRGITYTLPGGKRMKHSKDRKEYENAQIVYSQEMDWVVPILEAPQLIQDNPPLFKILMKELKPLSQPETMLVGYLANRLERARDGWIEDMVGIEEVMENYVHFLDVDKVLYLYNRMQYIFQQNSNTLWLTDLHAGNFGWDGNELKVWDIGPDRSEWRS